TGLLRSICRKPNQRRLVGCDAAEAVVSLDIVLVFGIGERCFQTLGRRVGDTNHQVRFRHGQWSKNKEIRLAEQACSHAQSKSHRDYDAESESFRSLDRPKAVTKI